LESGAAVRGARTGRHVYIECSEYDQAGHLTLPRV
jgi:hypothetical protein